MCTVVIKGGGSNGLIVSDKYSKICSNKHEEKFNLMGVEVGLCSFHISVHSRFCSVQCPRSVCLPSYILYVPIFKCFFVHQGAHRTFLTVRHVVDGGCFIATWTT